MVKIHIIRIKAEILSQLVAKRGWGLWRRCHYLACNGLLHCQNLVKKCEPANAGVGNCRIFQQL